MFGTAERIGDDGVESTLDGYKLLDGNAKDRVLRVVEVLFLHGGDGRLNGFRNKSIPFGGPVCEERVVAVPASVLRILCSEAVDLSQIFFDAIDIGLDVRGAWARNDGYDQFLYAAVHEVVNAGQLAHRNKARLINLGDVTI